MFNQALEALGISDFKFRPYSLRRGGATFFFAKHQNLDRILLQGRWHTQKSARIYINEGLSVLSEMKIPPQDSKLKPFLTVYKSFLLRPIFHLSLLSEGQGAVEGSRNRLARGENKVGF